MNTLEPRVADTLRQGDAHRHAIRSKAREIAMQHHWLEVVLRHHEHIEAAFAAVRRTDDPAARLAAQARLGIALTGHAMAEESVLYPALARAAAFEDAAGAYREQAAVKMQMAALERVPPMSRDYLELLEVIRSAVVQHMCEEEGTRFLELTDRLPAPEQQRLEQRYQSEFARYVGTALGERDWGMRYGVPRRAR